MPRILLGLVFLLSLTITARAGSLETAPTTIVLSEGRTGVLHLANRAAYPVTIQVEAFDWIQDDGGERLEPSASLQASPPMAELAPGARQTVRLRALGPAAGREEAWRLLVSELPAPGRPGGGEVRVLLQVSMPVFAGGLGRDAALAWRARRQGPDVVLSAANGGDRHAKLSGLTLAGVPVPGGELAYVLPGAVRHWRVPAPPGEGPLALRGGTGSAGEPLDMILHLGR